MTIGKTDAASLYGLVLAGGYSTRMGKDKAALKIGEQTLAERAFSLLEKYCTEVFLSNRQEQSDLPGFKALPQIHDAYEIGRLSGILSAMEAYQDIAWLVLACDMPYVNDDTLLKLISERDEKKVATVFHDSAKDLLVPQCAIYEASSLKVLTKAMHRGVYSPREILSRAKVKTIEPDDPHVLDDLSTLDDYRAAAQELQHT